ncbi:MAG: LapA family protein [Actinomycetota bacterium]|nr:LapA family protein [Actinomycetota bacterium]
MRRRARRAWLYTWTGALVALLVILIALVVANTRKVEVSWVFGSTRQSLVWIILVTGIVGWLLGIVTSIVFRFRTRRPDSAP